MGIPSINGVVFKNLSNIPGWRTKRKLVVIESDDWGSIRMPSKNVFNNLINSGIDLFSDEGARFNKYDSMATSEDLASLFEVLNLVSDSTGRASVITPVSVVANPDFAKIQESDFTEFHYEPFTATLKRYPGCENSFNLWGEGISKRLFVPQFHGREHLNVRAWMRALKNGHKNSHLAFNNGMWGISTSSDPEIKLEFQAAFDFIDTDDVKYHMEVIETGSNLFEQLFGYRATYFVPPNGPFSSQLQPICLAAGLKFISGSKIEREPLGNGKIRKRLHQLGQQSQNGLIYITRNCFFEPSQPGQDWVDNCLYDISVAFRWHKPAVVSTHRVNYVGALDRKNRDNGLEQLSSLLNQVMKKWPDAEFITSAELGEIISID